MLEEFLTNINNNSLFSKKDFLLVAISGGVDSIVLADLLDKHKFRWAAAHCNFGLRLNDSEKDEIFVVNLAKKYSVPCFTIKFDTKKYAKANGISVQIAARELRYRWFDELLKIYSFDYLLTAHHSDDNTETILLNQLRGTGIKGMCGIPEKNKKIVRPLLNFTKEDILKYAQKQNLEFSEDISNKDNKYHRNYIRLNVIPELKKIQSQINFIFQSNICHFKEAKKYIDKSISEVFRSLIIKEYGYIKIKKKSLCNISDLHFVLHYFLSDFNFNDEQIREIIFHLDINTNTGKHYISKSHILLFDREYIFIFCKKNNEVLHTREYIAKNIAELNLYSSNYFFEIISGDSDFNIKNKKSAYINADILSFPLILRHKKDGDKFQLLGTDYQKKLSDVLIDKKVPLILKNKLVLLCNSNNEIVWISNLNLINEKYKVKENTNAILKISVNEPIPTI